MPNLRTRIQIPGGRRRSGEDSAVGEDGAVEKTAHAEKCVITEDQEKPRWGRSGPDAIQKNVESRTPYTCPSCASYLADCREKLVALGNVRARLGQSRSRRGWRRPRTARGTWSSTAGGGRAAAARQRQAAAAIPAPHGSCRWCPPVGPTRRPRGAPRRTPAALRPLGLHAACGKMGRGCPTLSTSSTTTDLSQRMGSSNLLRLLGESIFDIYYV